VESTDYVTVSSLTEQKSLQSNSTDEKITSSLSEVVAKIPEKTQENNLEIDLTEKKKKR